MSVSVAVRQKAEVTQLRAPPSHPSAVFFYLVTVYNVKREPAFISGFTAILYRRTGRAREIHKKREVVPKHVALFCAYYLFIRVLRRFQTRDA